jgi:hypothetical protein
MLQLHFTPSKQTCSTVVLLELVSVRLPAYKVLPPTSELRIRLVTTKIKQGKTECKQYWLNKSDHSEKWHHNVIHTTSTDYKYSLSFPSYLTLPNLGSASYFEVMPSAASLAAQ